MTDTLDMHAASRDEQAAAHANVFDIWSKGLPLEEHVQSRLESPKHRLADWYVGCLDGRVVVSLGSYPLRFALRGGEVGGMAIGSVYTVAEFRRRGHAARLIDWVEQRVHAAGVTVSLLYSDIDPRYYAAMGYVRCPSLAGWCPVDQASSGGGRTRLEEIDPRAHLDALASLYAGYHGAVPLSIARDSAYWWALLERFTEDRFFRLADAGNDWAGYVRLDTTGSDWRIRDFALADQDPRLETALYQTALRLAAAAGAGRLGGWLIDSPAARACFELGDRQTEITMIKSLAADIALDIVLDIVLDDALVAGTSRFTEIDHV